MISSDDVFSHLQRFRTEGTPCALVTVVRTLAPTSGKPGSRAVITMAGAVHGWIGGGCASGAVLRAVKDALADGEPRLIRVSPPGSSSKGEDGVIDFDMRCASQGTVDLFIEPMLPPPVVRVHGSAPVARHVVEMATRVGLSVQVLAPDTDAASFPGARRHAAGHDVPAEWPSARWSVVATQGQGDRAALEASIGTGVERIALIASRRKRDALLRDMEERGASAEALARVHAPAGVNIAARTPEEIALSVVAQLVEWRRSGVEGAGVGRDAGADSCCGQVS
ncbi:XdhC family protein [Aquisalimonas asiatica]|uniref:Xanthine dehydrogenase accessory factor n=1 Tax=Aquisalimonas asiatica TaxID=406100 RepID=A0A1H8S076_9GAMM|nr:XdhC family protein [Aquisalimonas asiatica]SEO72339.1 xanthine dehydrogenase accessory factor [Aquisalimonas asiatica]